MAKRDSTIGKHHSNLRHPPLFLRPSVVRGMIADLQGIHRAVVQVPLLDVRLVDMPRGCEDSRLSKANDDDLAENRRKIEHALDRLKRSDAPASMFPWKNDDHEVQSFSRIPADGPASSDRVDTGREMRTERGDVSLTAQVPVREVLPDDQEASPQPIPEVTEPAAAQVERASPKSQSDLGRSERASDSEEGTRARPASTKAAAKAERNQRIAAAYAAGDAIGEIAAQAGLSKARVLAIAVAAGIPPRPVGKNRLLPNLDRAAVAGAYARGLPVRTVAGHFGISAETVKACVRGHGGTLRPVGQRSPAYQSKGKRLIDPAEPKASPVGDNACEQHAKPSQEPAASGMLGPDAEAPEFKRPKPRLSQFEPPQAETPLPELSDAAFERAVPAAKAVPDVRGMAQRLAAKRAADTKLDPARVADAFDRRAANSALRQAQGERSKAAPLEPAPSREECPRCGIPGWKGCAHFLPCVDQPRQVDLPDRADRAEAQQFVPASVRGNQRFTGKRQGIGASRL